MKAGGYQVACKTSECDEVSRDVASAQRARSTWPIYVISLDGETERRAPLLSALSEMGLSAEVLAAGDGRNGLPDWAESMVSRPRKNALLRPLTDAELGCALSHAIIYRKILDENLPGAIIFEDDAKVDQRFRPFLEAGGHKLGDMVLLGHGGCAAHWACKHRIDPDISLYRIAVAPKLTHAYCVSHLAAQTLAMSTTPVSELADWPCDISRMNVLAAYPVLARQHIQDTENSHIEVARRKQKSQDILLNRRSRFKRIIMRRFSYSWWAWKYAKRFKRRLS